MNNQGYICASVRLNASRDGSDMEASVLILHGPDRSKKPEELALTPEDARELAKALVEAADTADKFRASL